MTSLKKFFMVLALAVPLTFTPTKCANASAAGEAALLLQQIVQWINDIQLDNWKKEDWDAAWENCRKIAEWVSKGTSAYSTVRDMTRLVNKAERITKKSTDFIEYAISIDDDDLRLDRIVLTSKRCISNVKYIYQGLDNIISDIQNWEGENLSSKDVMDMTDKAMAEASDAIDAEINDTQDDWTEYQRVVTLDMMKEKARNFDKIMIY